MRPGESLYKSLGSRSRGLSKKPDVSSRGRPPPLRPSPQRAAAAMLSVTSRRSLLPGSLTFQSLTRPSLPRQHQPEGGHRRRQAVRSQNRANAQPQSRGSARRVFAESACAQLEGGSSVRSAPCLAGVNESSALPSPGLYGPLPAQMLFSFNPHDSLARFTLQMRSEVVCPMSHS